MTIVRTKKCYDKNRLVLPSGECRRVLKEHGGRGGEPNPDFVQGNHSATADGNIGRPFMAGVEHSAFPHPAPVVAMKAGRMRPA